MKTEYRKNNLDNKKKHIKFPPSKITNGKPAPSTRYFYFKVQSELISSQDSAFRERAGIFRRYRQVLAFFICLKLRRFNMNTTQNPIFAIRKKPEQSYACILSEKLIVLETVVKYICDQEQWNENSLPIALESAFEDFNSIFRLYHYENFELNIPTEKKLLELSAKHNEMPSYIIEKMLKGLQDESN